MPIRFHISTASAENTDQNGPHMLCFFFAYFYYLPQNLKMHTFIHHLILFLILPLYSIFDMNRVTLRLSRTALTTSVSRFSSVVVVLARPTTMLVSVSSGRTRTSTMLPRIVLLSASPTVMSSALLSLPTSPVTASFRSLMATSLLVTASSSASTLGPLPTLLPFFLLAR